MPLSVNTQPLVPKSKPYPPGVGSAPDAVLRAGGQAAAELAQALHNIEARANALEAVLRQKSPVVDKILVVDSSGRVIAALGDFIFNGVPTTNYFSEIHIGDPLNTGDPSQALFSASGGKVTIGQNGSVNVLDPYGADAAWIGAQFDTLAVTGAADNGSGLIRLTVTGHTLSTGDSVHVLDVGGVPNATGIRTVTSIDANHIDLQATVFVGTYTSGGTVDRILHIAGVANAAGLARIQTAVAHAYESGDRVHLAGVGSGLNGQWTIIVIDATHFDLVGSTFTGGTNGTALRFFAGGLFQTIAIGPSFVDYRLRMFADGTMRLRNAEIDLVGAGGSIVLDPAGPSITATDTTGNFVTINGSAIGLVAVGGDPQNNLTFNQVNLKNSASTTVATLSSNTGGTEAGTLNLKDSTAAKSVQLDPSSATAINTVGGGNINTSGAYKVAGTQVVGPQLTAISAPSVSTSAVTAGPAPATYTVVAINMLDQLKASVVALNASVISMETAINDIRGRLAAGTGHGLTA